MSHIADLLFPEGLPTASCSNGCAELRATNAELLAALETVAAHLETFGAGLWPTEARLAEECRAAIARAKGETA